MIWRSKKQPIVTLSSGEAEYVSLSTAGKDVIWVHKLMVELAPFFDEPRRLYPARPTQVYTDSQNSIALTKDSVHHERTKHIDVRYHWIRQTVEQGHFKISYCDTNNNVADLFTKALGTVKFVHFRDVLGLGDA